jgi:predicted TIM-barrel fold metal-dependent hydrolase
MEWTRRQLLLGVGLGAISTERARAAAADRDGSAGQGEKPGTKARLDLAEFQPRSMLHVRETRVERSRFPVIDVHTHLGWAAREKGGVARGEEMTFLAPPDAALEVMDSKNLRMVVNLTGGYGKGLAESVRRYDHVHPGRFLTFTEPWWSRLNEPGYPAFQADELARAREAGAGGLKVTKTLGLYLREKISTGPLVKVDDPRLDPMWDACASLNMPVAIHVADPEAFFLPTDRFNERFEELNNHPDWSFFGRDFPSFAELLDAFYRVVAKHPRTQFIALHFGLNAENLASVSERLDRYRNVHVDLAARIGELGRQPRAARAFFDRHQDRIVFGTDAVPGGYDTPQQIFGERLYEIYYRFLETEDEYFDYAPAPVPPQGRWEIYGLGLTENILRKVYHDNAARLLGLNG